MTAALFAAAALAAAIWAYLLLFHGGFWLGRERDDRDRPAEPATWPSVVAVVPARDEAAVIGRAVSSLLAQDYPGAFRVLVVDDGSSDGTADLARAAAAAAGAADRLTVLAGAPLPHGWTGKLWAQHQGAAAAGADPELLLLTDADIAHAPGVLRDLVARAEAGGLALVSLMARLHVGSLAEKALIPAFVFFFQMLYPFGRVNDPRSAAAGAAGGVMLVRRRALEAAGGLAAIRGRIIDDCALGALLKRQGAVWLGLTDRAVSLRPYGGFADIGAMVARCAYAQLDYSPLKLAGTVLGLALVYLVPVAAALVGEGWTRALGAAAWAMMAVSFQPMLRRYGRSPLWGLALPAIAACYLGFTVWSAVQVWGGRGGQWKGRAQALQSS